MKDKVIKAINQFSLIEKNKTVTVALSGGADSMSLLYLLNNLKDELSITLNAAHLNHLIRGEEAYSDEEFVKLQCEKLGIPLFVKRVDIPKISSETKESTELCARRERYAFLESVSTDYVATAHTLSDNLETVLFNLTRGSGLDGLSGIPPKRDIFIRPLILATREDVEEYCRNNNIPFVTDSTNLSDDYSRNLIRHKVVPVLKSINPAVECSVGRTVDALREDNTAIKALANTYLTKSLTKNSLSLDGFSQLLVSVQKRVIIGFVKSVFPEISLEFHHIAEILNAAKNQNAKVNLPQDKFLKVSRGKLFLGNSKLKEKSEFSVEITECENDLFKNKEKINSLFLNNAVDCDKIIGSVKLRTRLSGDKIMLSGRGCTKTLNKWFCENSVPSELRDFIPVLSDDKGVIWVYGLGVAQRARVTENTKKVLKIDAFLRGE